MSNKNKPLILGFGHRARQGKDEAARTILRERGSDYKIAVVAFADALRSEVNTRCEELVSTGMANTYKDALALMCVEWDVEFDPNAEADDVYKHGKQRALLQAIGQGRRVNDPEYWVKRWLQIVNTLDADVCIVTDMRYPNEMELIHKLGGRTVKFTRHGYEGLSAEAAAHISETALNGAPFDYHIEVNDGDLAGLHHNSLFLFDYLVRSHLYALQTETP